MALIDRYRNAAFVALIAAATVVFPAASQAADSVVTPKKKAHAAAKPMGTAKAKATRPVAVRSGRAKHVSSVMRTLPAAKPSFGQLYGLHNTADALELKSSVALVLDSETNEVLFSKNPEAVLPIASLTKLMTALVIAEANQPLDEPLTISQEDVDTEKFSSSRLKVGTTLSREEMLHLALMSSENRAAHALGRYYPGGLAVFVAAMNTKAQSLGMTDTHYIEPTGLSSHNQSSAHDLAVLVKAAEEHQMIRDFSTSPQFQVALGKRQAEFHTTNALVRSPAWDIVLQKTGFINEAGRCLVMQAKMAGRKLIMVFLDGTGKYSRIGDAERVRRWITALPVVAPTAVLLPKTAG